MKKEELALARISHKTIGSKSEEELEALLTKLNKLPRIPDAYRVGNYLDLEEQRARFWPSHPRPFSIRSAEDFFWVFRCELLFTWGLYGPCCVWARATVERELQNMALSNEKVSKDFKHRILRTGRNPEFGDYITILGTSISDCAKDAAEKVKHNGDWVIHHRLDQIVGIDAKKWFEGWGIAERTSNEYAELVENRFYGEVFRFNKEEDMALVSMKNLYRFEASREEQR